MTENLTIRKRPVQNASGDLGHAIVEHISRFASLNLMILAILSSFVFMSFTFLVYFEKKDGSYIASFVPRGKDGSRDGFFLPASDVTRYSLHLCMRAAPCLSFRIENMDVHDRERNVWKTQDVVDQAKLLGDTHLYTQWTWKKGRGLLCIFS